MTSIGGLVSLRSFALYCASKFALEGVSEGVADEVKEFGVRVTIVEPGAFRTDFNGSNNVPPVHALPEYGSVVGGMRQWMKENDGKQPGDPRKAAEAMIRAVESDDPPLRLMLEADAYGLWDQKRQAMQAELDKWRDVGVNTAFDGVQVGAIGG